MRSYLSLIIVLLLAALLLGLLVSTPVHSQSNDGQATVTVAHHYVLNFYGFGILNDTVTFSNPGTSPVQIPTVQLGIPDSIFSRTAGLIFVTKGQQYTQTKSENNGTTIFTIMPAQPTQLQPQTTSAITLESYVKDILNTSTSAQGASVNTSTSAQGASVNRVLLLISPMVGPHVDLLNLQVQFPLAVALKTRPPGFLTTTNDTGTFYQRSIANTTSQAAVAQFFNYSSSSTTHFQPAEFFFAQRAFTVSSDGRPQIADTILVKNTGTAALSSLMLSLLSSNITSATVVASSSPPLLNPKSISILGGAVNFAVAPFPGAIQPGENYSFTLVYDVPSSLVKISGGAVSVTIPHTPPVDGVVNDYMIQSSLPTGVIATDSSTPIRIVDATPIGGGATTTSYHYSLSVAWGAGQAVPIASLLFAVVFIGLIAYRQSPAESELEEEKKRESGGTKLLDVIKAFEDKLALVARSLERLASAPLGTMRKSDFDRIRSELDALRSRALQRLNEVRQTTGPGSYSDLLTQISEAAREEDRAERDLINLYEQYHTKRMREETFQKLLPNYRRRLNGAINRLSDLLSTAQKQAT